MEGRWNRKELIATGVLVLMVIVVIVVIATNPSRERHLDKTGQALLRHQREHAALCLDCEPADDIEEAGGSRDSAERACMLAGINYKNYIVFSVLTDAGIWEARTIGVCGCVFGPSFQQPYFCPADLELPKLKSIDSATSSNAIILILHEDRTVQHEESRLTMEEAVEMLRAMDDKDATDILIKAAEECYHEDVVELLDAGEGFASVQVTTFNEEGGNSDE